MAPFDRLSSNCSGPRGFTTEGTEITDLGKRAFDRLRPNVLSCSHTAVTDTPAWPKMRDITLLRVNGSVLGSRVVCRDLPLTVLDT